MSSSIGLSNSINSVNIPVRTIDNVSANQQQSQPVNNVNFGNSSEPQKAKHSGLKAILGLAVAIVAGIAISKKIKLSKINNLKNAANVSVDSVKHAVGVDMAKNIDKEAAALKRRISPKIHAAKQEKYDKLFEAIA